MNIDLLRKLSETPAVSGREENMRAVVREAMGSLVDGMDVDVMGNLIGRKPGRGQRKLMIAAHMDEIGFYVKYIDDRGFLRLQTLGGFDPRQLFAQRVRVHTRRGEILRGVLSYTTKPTHMLTPEEAKESPKIDNFFVDIGMPGPAVRERVEVGDMVTMDRTLETCGGNIIGKSLDNRVGLYVMIEALRAARAHEVDVYAVATVQEEIGLRGAATSAYAINPDIGVALDTTLANDFPGPSDMDSVTKLGQGVGIKIMDASLISHPRLVDHFRDIARRENIPHQMEILPRGGTDGGAVQRARGGIASITLSVPTRYIHTVNEMVSQADVESAVALLARFIEEAHTRDYRLS
jgi:putative aminopeptidase FrvX